MTTELPLALQTAYADLLDRAASAAFEEAFPHGGTFISKNLRNRRYWYFQCSTEAGRKQQYVGPETPELLERIAHHAAARQYQRDRQSLVSTLVRSAHLPRPPPQIGDIVAALAEASVFRLRGVLIGTVAYQTYSAMLGVRLAAALVQTGDVDIAQFADVSAAVADVTPAMLDILQRVDASFRPVPHIEAHRVVSYEAASGVRVDFLTPNKGPDTEVPRPLPAFGTDAQPLRFLDFLIVDPEPAVLLHGPGIYVSVPAPQRFAIHKLIVARRRRGGSAKQDKDIRQAGALLDALSRKRPHELRAAWEEAYGRGRTWRRLLGEGLGLVHPPDIRDRTLKAVGASRSIIPGLDLQFANGPVLHDADLGTVVFFAKAGGETVRCAVSHDALRVLFGLQSFGREDRLHIFRENRALFERFARTKYLNWPVEEAGTVLIRTEDVEQLRR